MSLLLPLSDGRRPSVGEDPVLAHMVQRADAARLRTVATFVSSFWRKMN